MPRGREPSPKGDYEVGYGRPPKHSRFKPGQSGNPKGRPKGRKNLVTIIEETLYRPVAITENGRKRKVPAIKAVLLSVLMQSLDGNLRAFDKVAKLMPMVQAALIAADGGAEESPAFDPQHDAEVLAELEQMIREAERAAGGKTPEAQRRRKNEQH